MRYLDDEQGQAMVFVALVMGLVMLGFLALAVDVGYLFREKRLAQAAADAAAVAAAEEGGTTGAAQTAANTVATMNGFNTSAATNRATVSLTTSSTGIYSNAAGAVAPGGWLTATVSQPIHTFFLGAFSSSFKTVTVAASAVASLTVTPACICLTGAAGNTLNMSNNASVAASGCSIKVNSNSPCSITSVGSASICAQNVVSESTSWDNSSCINNGGSVGGSKCIGPTTPVEGGAACVPPAWNPPALPAGITCYDNPVNGWVLPGYTANYTLPLQGVTLTTGTTVNEVAVNNTICYNSLNTASAASVTFQPGYTYYIKGDFTNGGGAPVNGSNVTFYVGGNLNWGNGVKTTLSAPTDSGGNPETLFYVNGTSVNIAGGDSSNLSGTLDAPNAAVTLNNGTGTNMKMDIDAVSLTMAGGATLNTYAQAPAGGARGGILDQ